MECNDWIKARVSDKTFADVGGLWGTVNERVSVAAKSGARETAMIDITPLGHESWTKFYQRCSVEGVTCGKSISANVNDPAFAGKAGSYDVVHCSGVIYHCPNPLYTVMQLASIAKEVLILGSTVIPSSISNGSGTIRMEENSCLFVPALNDPQRAVIGEFLDGVGAKVCGINLPRTERWSLEDYEPWWYLFTTGYVAALLEACGFAVRDTSLIWKGRAAYFLATRNMI